MSERFDAVVIGAGPAGAVAARELARGGLSVLLVEKRRFPRPKVCGGCLSGTAVRTLRELGLWDRVAPLAAPLDRFTWRNAGSRAVTVPTGGGYAIERSAFDATLVAAAVEAGVTFRDGVTAKVGHTEDVRVASASSLARGASRGEGDPGCPPPLARRAGRDRTPRSDEFVTLRSRDGVTTTVAADAVVVAAGLGGIGKLPPPFRTEIAADSSVGIGAIVDAVSDAVPPGAIVMASGQSGYAGLVRLADGSLDVAAAVDRRAVARLGPARAVTSLLEEAGVGEEGVASARWLGTPAMTRRVRPAAAESVFLVGDAAGYVEPFTGEGIGWAVASAREIAMHVADHVACVRGGGESKVARAWARRYDSLTGRQRRWCRAIRRGLRSGPTRRLAAGALGVLPGLARPVTSHLQLTSDA